MPGNLSAIDFLDLADPRGLAHSEGPLQVTSCDSVSSLAAPHLACDWPCLPLPQ
jgi:hypothetical protein